MSPKNHSVYRLDRDTKIKKTTPINYFQFLFNWHGFPQVTPS